MAVTPLFRGVSSGYSLVASDGAVFKFGNAQIYGSVTAPDPNHPIVGIAAPPAGSRYLLVASDGATFGI
jgi:hypothetical protein